MTANELRLDILGTSFVISADEEQSYLDEIFAQYRAAVENTQSISGIDDPLKVAILTGFLLCDEIHKVRMHQDEAAGLLRESEQRRQGEEREAEERAMRLIARIDEVLVKKISPNE